MSFKEKPAIMIAVRGWFSGACNDASPIPGAEPTIEAGCSTCGEQLGQSIEDDQIGRMYVKAEAASHKLDNPDHGVVLIRYDRGTHSGRKR